MRRSITQFTYWSVINIFGTKETTMCMFLIQSCSTLTNNLSEGKSPSMAFDFTSNWQFWFFFPSVWLCLKRNSCFVVAQEVLWNIEQNLATFEKIFADFHIPTSKYWLLAGFDEDLIQGCLGFLEQIHIFILSEPPDMISFLLCLLPALEPFSAFIFTDTSTHHIPSTPSDFDKTICTATYRTADELPSCFSTLSQSQNMDTGRSLNLGSQSRMVMIWGERAKSEKTLIDFYLLIPAKRAMATKIQNLLDQMVVVLLVGMLSFHFGSLVTYVSTLNLFKTFKCRAHRGSRYIHTLGLITSLLQFNRGLWIAGSPPVCSLWHWIHRIIDKKPINNSKANILSFSAWCSHWCTGKTCLYQ